MPSPTSLARRLAARIRERFERGASAPIALDAGLALVAVLTLALMGRDRIALPPPLPLATAVVLFLVFALRRPGPPRCWPDLPMAAALGVASAAAYLAPGLVLGHDTVHHIWGAAAYQNAWHGGDLFPIWLHHLGLGMPMPLFYGPLPFWTMGPIALAGGGPAHLLSGSFVAAGALAAISAWVAAAQWTGDRRAALVAAAAWAFAPYRLVDSNYRAALGEAWALALFPLVFSTFDRLLLAPSRRGFVFAALVVAAMTLAHPLSLAMVVVLLAVLGAARLRTLLRSGPRVPLSAAVRAFGAAIAGLALAGFFTVPLVAETRYINLEASLETDGTPKYALHAVEPSELLARRNWRELRWSRTVPSNESARREMPFYVGVVLLAGLAGGAVATISRSVSCPPSLPMLVAVGGAALALTLEPLVRLSVHLPGLTVLQFPWRFLGPASAAGALALGVLAARPSDSASTLHARVVATLLALAATCDGFAFTGAVTRVAPWRGLALPEPWIWGPGAITAKSVPEPWPMRVFGVFLPPWRCCSDVNETFSEYPQYFTMPARRLAADRVRSSVGLLLHSSGELEPIDSLPYARLWVAGESKPRALDFERGGGRIVVHLPRRVRGRLEIAEQYFPGWQVERAGRWQEARSNPDGLLAAMADGSTRVVRFRFDRLRRDRAAGWLLTLLTSSALALLLLRRHRPSPALGGPNRP